MSGPVVHPVFVDLVVVDVATLNGAPQIATFFGDLGARVIKVEHPRGDPLRQLVDAEGVALQWKLTNRNKACVTLDVAQPDGRALLGRLLERADLVVSALSASRLVAWGLDAATLHAVHPRLVAVNLTTYGASGPWADRPGSGTLAEAVAGLAHLTGSADGPPTLAPVGLGDHLGVLHGIIAALTGLLARGGARHFDVSMTQPILALLAQRLAQVARSGVDPGRRGNRFPTMAPRNAYRAADGRWVAITAGTDDLAARLFEVVGHPELATDARFRTNHDRVANVDALDAFVGDWIATRRAATAVDTLLANRVSAAVVDDVPAVLANEHFRARGEIVTVDEPGAGTVTTAAPAIAGLGTIRHLGRDLGADNAAIYEEWLGIDAAELARLRAASVV
jgi:crotonobetainyl-CoA:carnitine CoA-transferase CaiB-like acyl-CoA transferase